MSRRKSGDDIERRLDEVRRRLATRHAGIEPDAQFAARVLARLPRSEGWSIGWAARRVLPVSVALALVLVVAVFATGRSAGRTAEPTTATASSGTDPLEWLLEGGQDVQ